MIRNSITTMIPCYSSYIIVYLNVTYSIVSILKLKND